jgi:hypothetical protein
VNLVEGEAEKRDVDPPAAAPKKENGYVGATLIWTGLSSLIRVLNILADGRVRFTSHRRVCR